MKRHRYGLVQYKCRRCHEIEQSLHVPNVMHGLICVVNGQPTPREWGMQMLSLMSIHGCKDGGFGVSDLVGGIGDVVKEKSDG